MCFLRNDSLSFSLHHFSPLSFWPVAREQYNFKQCDLFSGVQKKQYTVSMRGYQLLRSQSFLKTDLHSVWWMSSFTDRPQASSHCVTIKLQFSKSSPLRRPTVGVCDENPRQLLDYLAHQLSASGQRIDLSQGVGMQAFKSNAGKLRKRKLKVKVRSQVACRLQD